MSHLQKTLKNVKYIALIADFWADRRQNSFLCVTAHHVDNDFNSKSTLLHFQSYNQRHSASNISGEVYSCLREFGIEDKVTSVTCDGASNMTKAFDIFDNIDRFWCIAHRLHLTICNGFLLWKNFKKSEDELDPNNDDFTDLVDLKSSSNENDIGNTLGDAEQKDEVMQGNIWNAAFTSGSLIVYHVTPEYTLDSHSHLCQLMRMSYHR